MSEHSSHTLKPSIPSARMWPRFGVDYAPAQSDPPTDAPSHTDIETEQKAPFSSSEAQHYDSFMRIVRR